MRHFQLQDRFIHKHRLDRKTFGPDDSMFLMLVLFGRLHPQPSRAPYPLPERVRFVALPYYARATDVVGMVRDERNFPVGRFRETLKLPPGTEYASVVGEV